MNPRSHVRRTFTLGLMMIAVWSAGVAGAATFTVTSTADSGAGSLRRAIADAAGIAGADTIAFNIPGAGVHTITLTSVPLTVANNVIIDGRTQPGYAGTNLITVSGNNASMVFMVTAGTVAIHALTITGGGAPGNRGGGVWNGAALTMTNCIVSGNSAGWGGGICNEQGTLTLTGCSVSANSATMGAGIVNLTPAPLTLIGCTISGNSATGDGGGVWCSSNAPSPLTLTNCTFSGNTAGGGGGAIMNGGALTLTCCTFSGNTAGLGGGGIYNLGTLTLTNSIIANNAGGDIYGGYTDNAFNIVEDGVGITHFLSRSGDPLLGPLADNGGPTLTHALLPGSPAANAGNCAAFTLFTDQRGITRPNGPSCDIGAYEYEFVPTTTTLTVSPNPAVFGEPVTFAVTVAVTPPADGTPTGSVTFYAGAIPLMTGPVVLDAAGSASIIAPLLAPGYYEIRAEYVGDAYRMTSGSAYVPCVVNRGSTVTTVSSSTNPSLPGQTITITAVVSASSPAAGTPTGTLQFAIDGNPVGSPLALTGGTASIGATFPDVGNHEITASYSGDVNFTAGASTVFNQAVRSASTTTLTSSPNPSVFGQSVTLTATVAPGPPASGSPTGTVTFNDGAAAIGTAALGASGVATFSTSALPPGDHSITATYSGDATFGASTSAPLTQDVNPASSMTSLTSSLNPSVFGQSVTLTVTVAPAPPGAGSPTGTVQFVIDGANVGDPVALSEGSADISVATLAPGTHPVVANYSGDAAFAPGSGSLAGGQVVSPAEEPAGDTTPPSPNPAAWLTPPTATGATSIHMEAVPATDPSAVEYLFECVSGGGHSSGWQDSPTYDDTGLPPGTTCSYRVQTRDKSPNRNTADWSSLESATTEATPPDPGPPACGAGAPACAPLGILQLAVTMGCLRMMKRRRA